MLNYKKYRYLLFLLIITALVFAHSSVYAEETVKDKIAKNYKETKDICPVIKKFIKEAIDAKEVVMASIQLGHDACLVIRCAIEAEGNFERIVAGALAGGATADVCSRCMIEAGVNPQKARQVLETALGSMGPGLSQIDIDMPGDTRGGGFVSPHSFE